MDYTCCACGAELDREETAFCEDCDDFFCDICFDRHSLEHLYDDCYDDERMGGYSVDDEDNGDW